MTDTSSDAVQIRITPDGICFIDEEYFTPTPGVQLDDAVLAHLQLEAASMEVPVRAVIQDEQARYTTAIQVNIDGTSHLLVSNDQLEAPLTLPYAVASMTHLPQTQPHAGEPVSPARPYESLPEPYRGRLVAICATANQNFFTEGGRDADQLLAELSVQFGARHLYTLAVGTVRADIAWLSHDFQYALKNWVFMARAWHFHLGARHSTTVRAVGNALDCWRRLHPSEATESLQRMVTFLNDVEFPYREEAMLTVSPRARRTSVTK